MSVALSWGLFGLGGLICISNFYLSYLRYPLHRIRGHSKASFRWVSGLPFFGSLFVAIALLGLYDVSGLIPVAIGLILIDTGGIHWMAGSMLYNYYRDKRQK